MGSQGDSPFSLQPGRRGAEHGACGAQAGGGLRDKGSEGAVPALGPQGLCKEKLPTHPAETLLIQGFCKERPQELQLALGGAKHGQGREEAQRL